MGTRINPLLAAKRLWGWEPHSDGQRDWVMAQLHPRGGRVLVAACGRRWGKSEGTAIAVALYALLYPNQQQYIVAPTEDQTKQIMSIVSAALNRVSGLAGEMEERLSPYWEIRFRDGDGLTGATAIKSRTAGTSGRGLRGNKAHRVIVDEAAFVGQEIIDRVISPMLADYNGQLVLESTPDGLGYFYQEWRRGQSEEFPRYQSFRFPTSSNPYIPREYLAAQEASKPQRVWRQEYLAAFEETEGAVFRGVMPAVERGIAWLRDRIESDRRMAQYVFGVDWGRSVDYTAIAVFDITHRVIVELDRFNQIGWEVQRGRLRALYERYRPLAIVAECNSIGEPQVAELQREGLPVQPFTTTNASKSEIVDGMALALERADIGLCDNPVMQDELLAYRENRLPSGLRQYGAPEGQHDDTVMAVMLAVWGGSQAIVTTAPSIYG